ncbi:MAG: VWA domain-containing protein [Sandaracinaceae bacterium]
MNDLTFAAPGWLAAGALSVAALLALAGLAAWRRRRALARFAGDGTLVAPSVGHLRRGLKLALLASGIALLFTAAARPRWGFHTERAERQGVDVLFAIDASRSMLAEDLRPNRLTRAKLAVSDLLRELPGDRAGLVAFAGRAFLECPMTLDRDVFDRSLAALDTSLIPQPGTNLAAAIREATAAFGDVEHEKVLVLLTDGENLEEDAVAAAEEAAQHGVRIFTVGVGTADPSPVPITGPDGRVDLLRDADGQVVRSALDETTLRRIAEVTNGAYEPLGADGRGLARLYGAHLAALPRHAVAERMRRVPNERFQWPLGLGLLLLMVEPLIGERRWRWRARRLGRWAPAAAATAALLIAAPVFAEAPGAAAPSFFDRLLSAVGLGSRAAEDAYRRGDYEAAEAGWSRDATPTHVYNAAAAAYRAGDFERAEGAFDEAIHGGDPSLQERAYYGLGNARFRRGEAALERDREATKTAWRASIDAYESALALDAGDEDARFNLELVRRRLAALEEEEPPPEESASCDDPSDEGGGQNESDEQSQGGQGDQDQQSQGDQDPQSQGGQGDQDQQSQGDQDHQSQGGQGQQDQQSQGDQEQQSQGGQGQQDQPRQGDQGQRDQQGRGDQEQQDQQGQAGQGQPEPQGQAEPPQARPVGAGQADGEAPEDGEHAPGFAGSTGPGEHVGRLTREQAEQLLRALTSGERRFPRTDREGDAAPTPENPTRSW